jgi:hypothetical protein
VADDRPRDRVEDAGHRVAPGRLSALLEELVRGFTDPAVTPWERALRPGAVVDHYELLRELGQGGFGIVYEARDRRDDRPVAFKACGPAVRWRPARRGSWRRPRRRRGSPTPTS